MEIKEKVIIISLYNYEELDLSVKKEEMLKKYCENKGYEVEKIFRDIQYWGVDDNLYTFINSLKEAQKNKPTYDRVSKVIIYSIKEFTEIKEEVVMYGALLNLCKVELETIEEGILGQDIKCFSEISYDDNIKNQNKEFIVNEDTPF